MSPQTLMVVISIVSIILQGVAAFFITRTAVAVLEARFAGYMETTQAKFDAQERHHEATDREVLALRERVHTNTGIIQGHHIRIHQLELAAHRTKREDTL